MTIASAGWVNHSHGKIERCSYLGEKCVKAVHFLALLNEGIVLRHTAKGQLVHQVDLVRLDHVFVLVTENVKQNQNVRPLFPPHEVVPHFHNSLNTPLKKN